MRARELLVLPTLEAVVADPNDAAALPRVLDNMDAAVNLVGILHEGGHATFRSAHVELPRRLAEACRAAGVRHLVHMSALGAARDAPSEYQRSKAEGEESARSAGVPCTILRPSVIFGEHDRFLNFFATLARYFPVIPLAGARARFQPVWVEDVARAIVAAIGDKRAVGAAYALCGPRVYTLAELVRTVGAITGHRRPVVGLPAPAEQLQAFVLEHLPGKKMTRDNLRSMRVDNVCPDGFPEIFGFEPSPLEAIVPQYLAREGLRDRYDKYRHYAGR
jgi:NADH dehydrogenase